MATLDAAFLSGRGYAESSKEFFQNILNLIIFNVCPNIDKDEMLLSILHYFSVDTSERIDSIQGLKKSVLSLNTKIAICNTLLLIYDQVCHQRPLFDVVYENWQRELLRVKDVYLSAQMVHINKNPSATFSYETFKKQIKETLTYGTVESVLMKLYLEIPARDDFDLKLEFENDIDLLMPGKNYLCFDIVNFAMKVVIFKSKTIRNGNFREYPLSKELTEEIVRHVIRGKKLLFSLGKNRLLISKLLKRMGLYGSLNTIRRMHTTEVNNKGNAEEIADMAYKSMHAVKTSKVYEGSIQNGEGL